MENKESSRDKILSTAARPLRIVCKEAFEEWQSVV